MVKPDFRKRPHCISKLRTRCSQCSSIEISFGNSLYYDRFFIDARKPVSFSDTFCYLNILDRKGKWFYWSSVSLEGFPIGSRTRSRSLKREMALVTTERGDPLKINSFSSGKSKIGVLHLPLL